MILSAMMANNAAGIAPRSISWLLTVATPLKMGSPNPPAPISAAIVAVPITITVAVRNPATITGSANGNSTL